MDEQAQAALEAAIDMAVTDAWQPYERACREWRRARAAGEEDDGEWLSDVRADAIRAALAKHHLDPDQAVPVCGMPGTVLEAVREGVAECQDGAQEDEHDREQRVADAEWEQEQQYPTNPAIEMWLDFQRGERL
jgi:hypothetical protein